MTAVRWGVRLVAFYLLLHSLAFAQVTTADIVGRVTDSTGAVLPGATVTITNEGTRDVRSAPTTRVGRLRLQPPAHRHLRRQGGTAGIRHAEHAARCSRRATAPDSMRSSRSDRSRRTSPSPRRSPLLQTDTSTVGSLINLKEVQDLPVNGRNFIRLIQGLPGANEGLPNSLASGTRPDDRRQTSAISINGAADNQNNQLIDGMDNNERAIGTIGVKPSIDAIAEIKVQTSNYTAEAGRTAGGVVNIITKSGTNTLLGLGLRVLSQRSLRLAQLLLGHQAAAQAASVRRQPWRAAPDRPDVLLRRLRGLLAGPGGHEPRDAPDSQDAGGRFLRAVRAHLRSADDAADAVPRQSDPGEPSQSDRAEIHGAAAGQHQRQPRQQLRQHHAAHAGQLDGRRPHRLPVQQQRRASSSGIRSTTSIRLRRRRAMRRRKAFSPGAAAGWRSRGRTTPRRTGRR